MGTSPPGATALAITHICDCQLPPNMPMSMLASILLLTSQRGPLGLRTIARK